MTEVLSRDAIRDQVIALIVTQSKVDPAQIHPDSTLKDLGIASLDAIELFFDIEETFNITFPDEGPNFITDTVQCLLDAVAAADAQRSVANEGKA